MKAVSNTGPLIALAKVDSLYLLRELFGEVLIPSMVHRELCAKGGTEWEALYPRIVTKIHEVIKQ